MRRMLFLAVLIVTSILWAGEAKEYLLTLKVIETDAITSKVDGTRTTTTCSVNAATNDVTCESERTPDSTHTDLVSIADLSDGKRYTISCVLGAGARFLSGSGQAMSANAGLPTVSGCRVPPGAYKARWDKGRLKVLHERNGNLKETTSVVLTSAGVSAEQPERTESQSTSEKIAVRLSSTPAGAEIEIDGRFVGETPSTIFLASGEYNVRISKNRFKQWQRKLTASGGDVTLAAELEPEN